MSWKRWFRDYSTYYDTAPHTTPEGKEYFWFYKPRSRRSPGRSELFLKRRIPVQFTIKKEGFLQKLAKFLGFATEFQTNDLSFDQHYYIYSDDMQFTNILRSTKIREYVRTVFEAGAREIKTDDERLTAVMIAPQLLPDRDVNNRMAEALHHIADALAGITLPPNSPAKAMARLYKHFCIGMVVLGMIGIFALISLPYKLVSGTDLIKGAFTYSVPVVIACLFILREIFKGSARGVSVFAISIFAGIPLVILLSYLIHYLVNIHFDDTSPSYHTQSIQRTYTTRHKNRTHYHVQTNAWRQGETTFRMTVSSKTYQKLQHGGRIVFKTHPGYLNAEWIEDYEVRP